MKALSIIVTLTFILCLGLGIKIYQLTEKVDILQSQYQQVQTAVIIPEGDMLLKQIANYAAGHYHVNGVWPKENKLFDLGPGAQSRNWYFESAYGIVTGNICITIRHKGEYEQLSAVVHPDSSVTYLLTGELPYRYLSVE
ncbi:MAG: hypothetical protein AAB445_04580 [Patescibacteria group bacterium]